MDVCVSVSVCACRAHLKASLTPSKKHVMTAPHAKNLFRHFLIRERASVIERRERE